jgi:hypothetical protein
LNFFVFYVFFCFFVFFLENILLLVVHDLIVAELVDLTVRVLIVHETKIGMHGVSHDHLIVCKTRLAKRVHVVDELGVSLGVSLGLDCVSIGRMARHGHDLDRRRDWHSLDELVRHGRCHLGARHKLADLPKVPAVVGSDLDVLTRLKARHNVSGRSKGSPADKHHAEVLASAEVLLLEAVNALKNAPVLPGHHVKHHLVGNTLAVLVVAKDTRNDQCVDRVVVSRVTRCERHGWCGVLCCVVLCVAV